MSQPTLYGLFSARLAYCYVMLLYGTVFVYLFHFFFFLFVVVVVLVFLSIYKHMVYTTRQLKYKFLCFIFVSFYYYHYCYYMYLNLFVVMYVFWCTTYSFCSILKKFILNNKRKIFLKSCTVKKIVCVCFVFCFFFFYNILFTISQTCV